MFEYDSFREYKLEYVNNFGHIQIRNMSYVFLNDMSSSTSNPDARTDFPDSLSLSLFLSPSLSVSFNLFAPFIHRSQQILQTTYRACAEMLRISSCSLTNTDTTMSVGGCHL